MHGAQGARALASFLRLSVPLPARSSPRGAPGCVSTLHMLCRWCQRAACHVAEILQGTGHLMRHGLTRAARRRHHVLALLLGVCCGRSESAVLSPLREHAGFCGHTGCSCARVCHRRLVPGAPVRPSTSCTLDPCEPLIASFREMCTHPCDAVTAQCLLPCQHRSTCSRGIRLAVTRCTAAVGGAPRSASCKLRPASANRRRQCSLRCTLSSSQPATGSTIAVYSASCPRHSRPRGTGARFAQHADGSEPRVAVNVPGNETTLRLRLSFGGCARAGLRTVPRVHHRALCALAKRWSPAWICTQSTCQRSAGGPCRWTGTAVVGLCIASWLRCITSDPGRVDTSNVQGWLQVHPSDDGLYLPKR